MRLNRPLPIASDGQIKMTLFGSDFVWLQLPLSGRQRRPL
jgi:hypothetical protein